jgi:protocatechuate 3,4-dioxygenase beta subunit
VSQTRREFICRTAMLVLAGNLAASCRALPKQSGAAAAEPRLTAPPGEETAEIKTLIDKAQTQLETPGTNTAALLSDPTYLPAHEWPRFRELIRKHAQPSATVIVTAQEPGEPLIVSGLIRSRQNTPLAGALVYCYQTSARGWYSDRAPHVSGNSGDQKHARLFGYMITNREGAFEFRTVRPAGYPHSTLPQHIHVEISGPESSVRVTEIQFDDDPRLTAEMRVESANQGFQISRVTRDAAGVQRVTAEFRMR